MTNLIVSWPSSAGYLLQTNGNLATTNWTNYSGTVNTGGETLSVTITPQSGKLFFRLFHP